jgi:hypothetical protein
MKNYFLLLSLSFIGLTFTTAFSQNALHFDGVNDQVTIPNASAEIANTNQMSLSCWVFPTTAGGPYGIVGMRNNTNADFYLLQLNATSMECRFRNSSGTNYDIVYTGFTLNQWQHYTFTYDIDTLRLYKNGLEVAKAPASGTISNSAVAMLVGNSPWSTSNFWFRGTVDEVSLWDKTISATEANCLYTNGVNPYASNLKNYYDFNHGVANGNNAGVNVLVDRTNNINGTVMSLALSGTASNWVPGVAFPTYLSSSICLGDSSSLGGVAYYQSGTYFEIGPAANGCDSITTLQLTVTAETVSMNATYCDGESYLFRSKVLTAPGTYYDTLNSSAVCDTVFRLNLSKRPSYTVNRDVTICHGDGYLLGSTLLTEEGFYSETFSSAFGCDSTINVDLDVDTVNVGVTVNGNSLIANALQGSNTYQWYDCNAKIIVNGETNRFFTKPDTGAYAVIVTHLATGCVDTSACSGRVVGIASSELKNKLALVPHPAKDRTMLLFGDTYNLVTVELIDHLGKVVGNYRVQQKSSLELDVSMLIPGLYFIRLEADGQTTSTKLLKH